MQQQDLARLLSQSGALAQQLIGLKNALVNKNLDLKFQKPSQIIVQAIQRRSLLRTLAQALEGNRNFVQIKKQKIEKSRIVLEGLQSFKKTLKDQIVGYHTNVESIEQFFEEPLGQIDWENSYEQGQSRLKASLQKLRQKDECYKNKLIHKAQLQKQINDKNKMYNTVMPKHIKKLNQQLIQTTKVFGIEINENLQKIENPQLAYIYDIFKTLKVAQKIDVQYSKQQIQYIDLIIKPIKYELYERTLKYNIKLEEKQLKIRISNLQPQFNKLVIGVDRRSDFSSKDIFHRLINRQDAKPLFEEPSNQSQRNMNNKFIYVDWLQEFLTVSAFKSSQFLSTVRNRTFTVALTKYIFDNIKNPVWIGPINPILPAQLSSRRFLIQSDHKISFLEYRQLVNIPTSVKKSLNNYQQKSKKQILNSTPQKLEQLNKTKKKLLQILSKLCVEQLIIPELYQYHKITVNYKGLKIQTVIIIPYQYPSMLPKFKIINFDRIFEQDSNDVLPAVECKAKIVPSSVPAGKTTSNLNFGMQLETLQRLLNTSSGMAEEGNEPFSIIYHLNKLFTSIYRMQNQFNKGYK